MANLVIINKSLIRPCYNVLWLTRSMCTPATPPPSEAPRPQSMSARYRPNRLQKFVLVWTKKYKTQDEIPAVVSADLIERSKSEARIKLSNRLMLLTALASLGAIIAGKSAAKRGDSVTKMNEDFHAKYNKEYKERELEAAARK